MKKNLKSVDLNLIAGLTLSVIVLIMGIIIMIFKAFGLTDIILYVSILFYIYAFFSIIAYFVKRKEGDYELLLLSLINIIVATYMFVFQKDNLPMILGSAMTVYTILMVANRGYKVLMLKGQNNFIWVVKFIMTFLLAFIGILTTINLFNETTVQTMMMGYYFITTGVLMTIESSIELFVTDRAFNKIVSKLVDEENSKLEEVEVNESKEETILSINENTKPKKKPAVRTKKEVNTKAKKETNINQTKAKPKVEQKKNTVKKEEKPKTTEKKPVKEKAENQTKKAGRPKKEAAVKETKAKEIKIVEKKTTKEKPKKEVKSSPKSVTPKASVKKATSKKNETTKISTKTEPKIPGRPKKVSSK